MKLYATAFLVLFLSGCTQSPNLETAYTVSGTVVQTREYCSGAAPPPELLQELRAEKPVAGKTIFVREGVENTLSNIVAEFTSDNDGTFILQLPPGQYCFVEQKKKDDLNINNFQDQYTRVTSEQCLQEWWKQCDTTIQVTKDTADVILKYHETCPWKKPCTVYSGPLPP